MQRLERKRRFGVAATERKFAETIERTRPESIGRATQERRGEFFIPIGRNPLRSPDSEK